MDDGYQEFSGAAFGDEHIFPVLEWVAEQMPGGFFIYRADASQELLYVNTAVLRMFGCCSGEEFRELTGFTFPGMIHPDDLPTVQASIEAQIADPANENLDYVEYRIIRRDGEIRWVNGYGYVSTLPGFGDVSYVFIADATEKHLAQEENVRRAEVIKGLGEDFNSIYLIDLDSGSMRPYRLKNECFQTLDQELRAQGSRISDWRRILPLYAQRYVVEQDRARYLGEIAEARLQARLEAERAYCVNYRIQNPSGDPRYIEMSVVRIDGESLCHHAVMGFRDVTEQIQRIQRDTAEKLRMELELEREKQVHEAKNAFLFNISHDIRTPMNAIVGYTDLARRHIDEPDRLRDYLDKVHESNYHMLTLIDDLLEMSQIDSGRLQLRAEVCDLREQLEIALDVMAAQAEEKQIALRREFSLPEGEVRVDALRFRRIMTNLIGNAVKFTPPGGTVTVSARSREVSESGYARYEFQVSDTGVGMSEAFMARMYKAFEREESSTKSGNLGTGLGLSIVKSLLDAMGGSISVQSKKGVGSTFTVSLPIKLADGTDAAAAEERPTAEYAAKNPGERRILLVEDIEINRMLAETILEDAGFLVESVPDGCDAVDAISGHPLWYFDLILMDIQMPVMNGYEATRAIRAMNREDARELPIIALSANARDEDKRMSMESGMDNHIAKPFDVAHLITTINEHIEAREIKRSALS